MTEYIIICLAAFVASGLTFFSGFGLGTILVPVFGLFFPIELAIALTGIVHFLNSVFKLFLVGRNADKNVLIRFGIPAVIAAFAGAWLLLHIPDSKPLFTYQLGEKIIEVFPVKFLIALLLIFFAILDIVPFFNKFEFGKEKLPLGGILSGFFGGLSGNQGALRSAFLIKAGLTKEGFIGTAVVISCFVDLTRISVYATKFVKADLTDNITLIIIATLSAITGAILGNKLLKKVTLKFIQLLVAIMLFVIAIAMGSGLI
ncbi:MAG: sulfite exporter TauE/SafE family protein [Bacteroidetes bacterium]|nr:sulfite exporter TauE/SafE family protein [Bacteroidota bacterium]